MQQADNLGLIVMKGSEELGNKVDKWLSLWKENQETSYRVAMECPRFSSGEGKARIKESVRERDIFIISDITNYSITYKMRGMEVPMSPDEHYMDVKRVISALGGKASRITLMMPYLYCGRQDKRAGRESLDAALMLRDLTAIGVTNIIAFDAHNPCVENAVPFHGFDNIMPTYQMLKAMLKPGRIDMDNVVVVSPDEGAVTRNMAYAYWLKSDINMFYKQRDLKVTKNGMNPIIKHEYMGSDLGGREVVVVDDVLASGNSLLSLCHEIKARGAGDINLVVTFPLFTDGLDAYDEAFAQGLIKRVFATNLVYRSPELLSRPWYIDVDLSKYLSYIVLSIHQGMSINKLMNPSEKITQMLRQRAKHED